MAASPISGKVQTVLGPVDPETLGPTITHEHFLIDFTVVFQPPNNPDEAGLSEEELSLTNLGWIRHNWNSSLDNLTLLDEEVATAEASHYFRAGGRTMVDVTSNGLGRDRVCAWLVRRAGVGQVRGADISTDRAGGRAVLLPPSHHKRGRRRRQSSGRGYNTTW